MWPTLMDDAVTPTSLFPFPATGPAPGVGAAADASDGPADVPPDTDPDEAAPAGPAPTAGLDGDRPAVPDALRPAPGPAGDTAADPETPPLAAGVPAPGVDGAAPGTWPPVDWSDADGAAVGELAAELGPFPFSARSSSSR